MKNIKSLCLTTTPWRRMESGCVDPRILDLGTDWRWVVSFTHLPLYPWYRWTEGRVGPRTGLDDMERKNVLLLIRLELRPLSCPVRSQLVYRLALFQLLNYILSMLNSVYAEVTFLSDIYLNIIPSCMIWSSTKFSPQKYSCIRSIYPFPPLLELIVVTVLELHTFKNKIYLFN
jgi:hypothetical protein